MPEFGMPAFVKPENIKVPHKGTRSTSHFREDAQRPKGISDEEWDLRFSSANWKEETNSGNVIVPAGRRGGRLVFKCKKRDVELSASHYTHIAAMPNAKTEVNTAYLFDKGSD